MLRRSFHKSIPALRKFTTHSVKFTPKTFVRTATFGIGLGTGLLLVKPQPLNCDAITQNKNNNKSTTIAVANSCLIATAKDFFKWYNGTITTVEYVKNITTAGVVTYTTIQTEKGVKVVIEKIIIKDGNNSTENPTINTTEIIVSEEESKKIEQNIDDKVEENKKK